MIDSCNLKVTYSVIFRVKFKTGNVKFMYTFFDSEKGFYSLLLLELVTPVF